MSSGAGYDAVVDVDDEVSHISSAALFANTPFFANNIATQGDLGHTDLQDDLEFHNSNFAESNSNNRKAPGPSGLPMPATTNTSGKRFLWSISFYQQFFDVDTSAVLQRCWAALFPRANFLDVLEGNPDLYGPFWIATTVVFILFLGGTISKYLATTGQDPFVYDFRLLSGMLYCRCFLWGRDLAEGEGHPLTPRVHRCRGSHLRLHPLCADGTISGPAILRLRFG